MQGGKTKPNKTNKKNRKTFCKDCERPFLWEYELKHHLNLHAMKEKFNDRTCEKAFGGPTSVKGHLLNKSGEKPHVGFLTVTPLLFSI